MTTKILVVLKRSSYRKWVEQEHDPKVQALLARGDQTVARMMPSHADHEETVAEVKRALERPGVEPVFHETPRGPIGAAKWDLVITVGGDGTLLAVSHQIGADVPLLGVNSAPSHSVGFFCAAKKGTVKETLDAALRGQLRRVSLTRMRVKLNDVTVHRRVLNEALFCHASPAATSRYILRITRASGEHEEEEQKSSGMWIGPAAGSTAAQRSAGGKVLPLSSTKIQYVVREPYTPRGKKMSLPLGLVEDGGYLTLRSKMRAGKIFVDGEITVHDVGLGDVVRMRRSDEPLTVLGLTRNGAGEKAS